MYHHILLVPRRNGERTYDQNYIFPRIASWLGVFHERMEWLVSTCPDGETVKERTTGII
jgi:hypothetical protein